MPAPLTHADWLTGVPGLLAELAESWGLTPGPAYPPGADLPLPPLPLGRGVMDVVRAHDRLGWHRRP